MRFFRFCPTFKVPRPIVEYMEERLKSKVELVGKDLRASHEEKTIESVIDVIEAKEGKQYEVTSEVLRTMLSGT